MRVNTVLLRCVHALHLMCCAALECWRWLRWLLQPLLPLRKRPLQQLPQHVGIVIGEGELGILRVAQVVRWCAEAGVRYLTLCDGHGELLRAEGELRAALDALRVDTCFGAPQPQRMGAQQRMHHAEAEDVEGQQRGRQQHLPVQPHSKVRVALRLVSLQTGRDEITGAACRLCELVAANKLPAEAIDEAAIDAQLKGACSWPEPALILQFCPELLLGGLLPWQCRVSHHLPMGRLRHATAAALHSALVEYDGVQQRHGA